MEIVKNSSELENLFLIFSGHADDIPDENKECEAVHWLINPGFSIDVIKILATVLKNTPIVVYAKSCFGSYALDLITAPDSTITVE